MKSHRVTPEIFDEDHVARGRGAFLLVALIVVVLVLFGSRTALSYYVEYQWFESLGYREVFRKTLSLQWTTFAVFSAATFLVVYGWFLGLRKAYGDDLPSGGTVFVGGQRLRVPVDRILRLIGLIGSLLIAVLTGASIAAQWPTLALFWYAPRSIDGVVDAILKRPTTFYLFTLPAWQLINGWLLTLAVIVCFVALLFVFLTGSTRILAGDGRRYVPARWRWFSLALALLLLTLAIRAYMSRFEYLLDEHTIFSGVTYADAHVMLPGMLLVSAGLVIGAAMAGLNASARSQARWLAVAVAPAIICYLAVQVVGWYVSNFIVKPNELVRERPYIEYNIDATRRAFGLDRVAQREFPAETTVESADPANNQATLQNIRLWDWRALQDTLRQIQEIRTYYDFPDIDIDRYEINGAMREVMLAARELNVAKLPESSRNWINEKLIYTHGYGITMNPVNGFTSEGLPNLILSNMPVQSTIASIVVKRPEIYFGELTNTDVYVRTRQQEFNYPQGQTNSLTSYEGGGGIVMGSLLRRILIAADRGDLTKVPFSDDINGESRLLIHRNVRERVTALAPFLTFDLDPYIVIGEEGRLFWMLDAFTTSDSYPYSSHYGFSEDERANYMRNSVKAVVDAYDGTTTFYVFDSRDPILMAYRQIFPGLFRDAAAMPASLRKHVRYPELLLKMQAAAYGLYHMTDPQVFYNREDLWTVATELGMDETGQQKAQVMEPNFVLMKLPGEEALEFVEILPFTPANRNNLIGWIAGRSDGAQYGSSIVYDFPKTRLVDGPLQIEARIDQNAQLSGQLTLWNQQGSHVRRGALLVIPCGRALLYAEPIYLQAERSPMPELRLVVLALQDRLAYGPTFDSALRALFGGEASSLTGAATFTDVEQKPKGSESALKPTSNLKALIAGAGQDLADYQRLTAEGKLGEAGQKLEELKRKLEELKTFQQ